MATGLQKPKINILRSLDLWGVWEALPRALAANYLPLPFLTQKAIDATIDNSLRVLKLEVDGQVYVNGWCEEKAPHSHFGGIYLGND
ncbi:hypothetical protein [Roseimaritima multifibrata]|uniref:hypothetical protein n=1 Tax=Roseimaritima multifibrata TaxID=1930274 RepID=UPI001C54CDED|nr:hypothetical protein [Roseimaritima multifibrata]